MASESLLAYNSGKKKSEVDGEPTGYRAFGGNLCLIQIAVSYFGDGNLLVGCLCTKASLLIVECALQVDG